jgi:hypothetical protein
MQLIESTFYPKQSKVYKMIKRIAWELFKNYILENV